MSMQMSGNSITETSELSKELFRNGLKQIRRKMVGGYSIAEMLESLIETIENVYPDLIGSFLLVNKSGQHLIHGCATKLPEEYCQAINGLTIGEKIGSCGSAAFLKEPVIVENIETHPNWQDYKDIALKAELRACWSQPVLASDGRVLGTFAMYYKTPKQPTTLEIELMEVAVEIAGIAIEMKYDEDALKDSRELLELISQLQNKFIADLDIWTICDELVKDLLQLTDSKFGYIGEVLYKEDGTPYLVFRGLTNIAWNPETQLLYEQLKTVGLAFYNMETIFGAGLVNNGNIVISNDPANDERRGGFPAGHPLVKSFIGLPVYSQGKLVGQIALANRPGGYDHELANYLKPLLLTCGNIIQAHRDTEDRKAAEIALKEAKENAEEANKKKSQFLANMSHELRTPLNAVIGYSQMMEKGIGGQLNERQSKYARYIYSSGHHLLDLVNDLLDISKIEAGKLQIYPESVEISPLISELKSVVDELCSKKSVHLAFDIQPGIQAINADPVRLKQILLNLISNAIKFNKIGGHVYVRINQDDNEQIKFEIEDNGIGIANENIEKIFSEFYQVDDGMARQHEGTGLGLALTKHLVELHGGTISFKTHENVGTTFIFTLPTVLVTQ